MIQSVDRGNFSIEKSIRLPLRIKFRSLRDRRHMADFRSKFFTPPSICRDFPARSFYVCAGHVHVCAFSRMKFFGPKFHFLMIIWSEMIISWIMKSWIMTFLPDQIFDSSAQSCKNLQKADHCVLKWSTIWSIYFNTQWLPVDPKPLKFQTCTQIRFYPACR